MAQAKIAAVRDFDQAHDRIGSFPAVPAGERRGRSTSISGLPSCEPEQAYLASAGRMTTVWTCSIGAYRKPRIGRLATPERGDFP